jgi:hypothetical protein
MLRRLIPALGQTLLSETDDMGLVKRLWEMKMSDGAEVSAPCAACAAHMIRVGGGKTQGRSPAIRIGPCGEVGRAKNISSPARRGTNGCGTATTHSRH